MTVLGAWNFSEGTGTTTADLSGNGRTMTVHGWGAPHNTGFSAASDGTAYACGLSGGLGLNGPSALGIMMWANLSTPSGNPDIITLKVPDESTYVGVYWGDSGHLRLYLQDSAGYQESALVSVPVGTWVHYAIALSATSVVLYMNAQVAATLTRSAGSTMGNLTSFSLGGSIGSSGASPGLYFDAQLLNTTPSQSDVKTAMHAPLGHTPTVTVPSMLIEWAADEGTGTTVADTSGNGHTGTAAVDGWVPGLPPHDFAASGNSTSPAVKLEGTVVVSGSKTLSMMADVYAVAFTGSGDLLEVKSDHSSTTYATIYRPSTTSLQIETRDTGGTTTDTIEYPKATTGLWTHIGAVIDLATVSLFVDGELAVTVPRSAAADLGALQLFYAGGTDTKFNQARVNNVRWTESTIDNDTMRHLANAPVLRSTSATIAAPAATASGSAPAPTVTAARAASVAAPAVTGTASAPSPAVSATRTVTVAAPAATGSASAIAPTVGASRNAAVAAGPAAATGTAVAPTVMAVRTVRVASAVATASALAPPPSVSAGGNTAVQAPVATASGLAPPPAVAAQRQVDVRAAVATAEAVAPAPSVRAGGGPLPEVPSARTLTGIPVRWSLTAYDDVHTLTGTPVTRTLTAKEVTG